MTDPPEPLYLIVTGTPETGYRYYGPLPDPDAALDAAERFEQTDWWVARLEPPVAL